MWLTNSWQAISANVKNSSALSINQNFQFQNEVEHEFRVLEWMLKKIKVISLSKEKHIQSSISNRDLQTQIKNLTDKVQNVGVLFENKIPVATADRSFVKATVEKIAALAQEMSLYAAVAQAVDYNQIHKVNTNPNGSSNPNTINLIEQAGRTIKVK